MSVRCRLADLTETQVALVLEHLTLQPLDPRAEEQKKWGFKKQNFRSRPPAPPILMFKISEDGQYVSLPFRFACSLLGKMCNQEEPHVRIVKDNTPPFEATLREYQVPQALELHTQLTTYGSTTLGLPPGNGKTILGIWLAYVAGYVTLIYTNREIIGDQWVKTIATCTPKLLGSTWFVGKNSPPPTGQVPAFIICMDGRFQQIPEEIRRSIGTLIIDEAHLFCTPGKVDCLLFTTPRHVIIETATLERDDGMHCMMQLMAGTHGIFKVSKSPYHVICVETGILVDEVPGPQGVNYGDVCKKLSEHAERNAMILDIVSSNPHRKFIVLGRLTDHVEVLEKLLAEAGIKCDTLYRSKNKYSDSTVLLGTMPKVGTGFDESNACADFQGRTSDVLLMLHSVKKWQMFEQLRGRVMRCPSPVVIWFNDKNQVIRRHFTKLGDWIGATNGTVVKISYSKGAMILPEMKVSSQAAAEPGPASAATV